MRSLPLSALFALFQIGSAVASQDKTPVFTPSPTVAQTEAFDRQIKAARSYLEGWFGAPMTMPPIEVLKEDRKGADADLPAHYQDGIIRVRAETLQKESEARRLLRHELAHAVIDQRTRGNCPHWLQEGIAQFLDGTDIVATNAWLKRDPSPLLPLFRIEGPFKDRDAATRERAYRESASAVSFLIARVGKSGLLFLTSRLGEGRAFDQALVETGLSYTELQQAWESSLRLPPRRP